MKQYEAFALSRLRRDFFGTPVSSLITLIVMTLLVWLVAEVFNWGVLQAVVTPD